ncbi:MAG: NADH:flavin oxidoreductase [Thermoplasmata archaeon]
MVVEEARPLLEKIEIGRAQIRNRFVRSATHEWLASEDGCPTEPIAVIHETLSKNGMGLCISGYAFVSIDGKGSKGQQGMHSDDVLPGYRELIDRVHKHGSAFFVQLVHNGRHSFPTPHSPNPPSASELPIPGTDLHSRAMTEKEIEKVINDFVSAIGRSKKAGADGIQLHCAHGFLLSSFISPFLNRREDDWGGDTTGRTRIVVEILRRAKKRFPEYPMAVKMNCTDGVEGGIDLDEAVRIAKILASEGIDAIEVSGGIEDAPTDITCQRVVAPEQEAYFKEYSKAIRRKVDCPVILVGGIRSLKVMRRVISDGYADMIAMSRPLIREPDLVSKILNGKKTEASCVSCNKCFDSTGVKCNRMSMRRS